MNFDVFPNQRKWDFWWCSCSFWIPVLALIFDEFGIVLGSKVATVHHKSGKKVLWAEYFKCGLTSRCRPFLNVFLFCVGLIAFWRTFDAFGSMVAPFCKLLAPCWMLQASFWYPFGSRLVHLALFWRSKTSPKTFVILFLVSWLLGSPPNTGKKQEKSYHSKPLQTENPKTEIKNENLNSLKNI